MPIYEYQCNDCGHRLEKIQKFSEEPLKLCPECNKESLRKLVSAAAFRLKGGGWYETDFKDKKSQKNVTGGNDSSSSSAETKTDKSESKDSAGKTETKTTETKAADAPAAKPAATSSSSKTTTD